MEIFVKWEGSIINFLFYTAYLSMIVLFGSLNPSQLTKNSHKTFRLFGLLTIFVISLDLTSWLIRVSYPQVKSFVLHVQVICIFIILYQLKDTKLSKISICSYSLTLVCLLGYSAYLLWQMIQL